MIYLSDFHDLQGQSTMSLCNTFNLAFSDYIVPVNLTPSVMEEKFQGENTSLEWSIGAFNGAELGAFILHGADDKFAPTVLYNGGTGVTPAYRGQHLVQKMYEAYIPRYQDAGVRRIVLEVLTSNLPAIKAYKNSGFEKNRVLECFKGDVRAGLPAAPVMLREQRQPNWLLYGTFMDMEPSWCNLLSSASREKTTTVWEALQDEQVIGFIAVNVLTRRVRSIAVDPRYRRSGVGNALLKHTAEALPGTLTVINIDDRYQGTCRFLEQAGLNNYITQYEMVASI
ncbi:Acetyltransferase (GNAT) domain-containing protein [Chitinophaga jiangningensis]|uniref:Acetyltransferase (GNAT) domain-containing protein n=1 Tax=Chitinophaga jiangningensis TaxID=1419482 RepID=A0A1M6W3W2_9BACT|nr:GNAT family N-acetyltransferase [Chitinophaga jiangningensis]SHK88454.1 Acetyltransferase (GNAT) domain-containing protein [Chitinophaga jiangningensis]